MQAADVFARLFGLAAALTLAAPAAHPQTPPGAPPPSVFLAAVNKAVSGQRVFVVNNGALTGPYGDPLQLDGLNTLARLQAVCEAFSRPDMTLIPFSVRGTWVLAPQSRNAEPKALGRGNEIDYQGRIALIQKALAQLPPERWAALGSEKGVPASAFPPEAKAWLARAIRPPLYLTILYCQGNSMMEDPQPTITDQYDLSAVRLRAQLNSGGILCKPPVEPGRQGRAEWQSGSRAPSKRRLVFAEHGSEREWGQAVVSPGFLTVPNTFKPSDLDGKAYIQPLAMSGVTTVEAVVAQIAKVTHLPLAVSPQYKSLRAYVGSPSVTCGEALDGLRLGLTAAWRKLGKTYILAWDREGLAVVMARMQAASKPVTEQAQSDINRALNGEPWRALAASLPFAADDPFAWTDAQRKTLLTTPPPIGWGESYDFLMPTRLPYSEMTAGQQEKARAMLAGLEERRRQNAAFRAERGYPEESGPGASDVASAFLCGTAGVEVSIELPGAGWALIDDTVYTLKAKRPERRQTAPRAFPKPAPGAPIPVIPPTPLVKADDRGVAVPPLPPDALAPVLKAMRAKGFKTLYYPALIDGYATFPTGAFPLHPALKGANGWAAAVKAARAAGLSVAATVNALVWQPVTKEPHWMDDRPDLIDRDILGRDFMEARALPGWDSSIKPPEMRGNLVWPGPEAKGKLTALLDGLARQPAPDGVLLDAWGEETGAVGGIGPDVSLGYCLAARAQHVADEGYDIADVFVPSGIGPPLDAAALYSPAGTWSVSVGGEVSLTPNGVTRYRLGQPPEDPHATLLNALLEGLRARQPRWTTMITVCAGGLQFATPNWPPRADAAFATDPMSFGSRSAALIHVPSAALIGQLAKLGRYRTKDRGLRLAEETGIWMGMQGLKRVVYDFRDAPEGIAAAIQEAVLD